MGTVVELVEVGGFVKRQVNLRRGGGLGKGRYGYYWVEGGPSLLAVS